MTDARARGSVEVSVLRSAGVASSFLFTLIVARGLGAKDAGVYFLVVTIITIVASLLRLGLEHALTRMISVGFSRGDWVLVNAAYVVAMTVCVLLALLCTAVVLVSGNSIAVSLFGKPELAPPLLLASWSLVPTTVHTLQAHAWQGRRHLAKFVMLQVSGLQILLLAAAIVLLLFDVMSVAALVVSYVLSSFILAVAGLVTWWRCNDVSVRISGSVVAALFKSAKPLFVVVALNLLLAWAGHLFVGYWGSTADVAVFATAYRVSSLLMLIATAITNVSAPDYAAYYAAGNMVKLESVIGWATRSMALATAPFALILVVFARPIMSLMGGEFEYGSLALALMVCGQAVNVLAGYPSFVLIMTRHERDLAVNVSISAIVMVLLLAALVPRFGVHGAAAAQGASVATQAIMNAAAVKRRLGIASWHGLFVRGVA